MISQVVVAADKGAEIGQASLVEFGDQVGDDRVVHDRIVIKRDGQPGDESQAQGEV